MTRHTDPRLIERDIDQDRAELAATLGALQDRVTMDNLTQEALGFMRKNAASYTKVVDTAVRANPLAVALVGAGLAWLIFGNRKSVEPPKAKLEALSTWEDDGGPARPSDERLPDWTDASDGLRRRASAALQKLESEARDATASTRDFAKDRAMIIAQFTEELRGSIRQGLEGLSEAAQEKIVAAREAADAARLSVERASRAGPKAGGQLIEDHPMIAGAAMLAFGAALGAMLPRSSFEDRAFGAERDRLMDQAALVFAKERRAENGTANAE